MKTLFCMVISRELSQAYFALGIIISFYAELCRNGKVWLGFTGSVREVSYISVKNFRHLRVYYASHS
jgi:hypothetical protein